MNLKKQKYYTEMSKLFTVDDFFDFSDFRYYFDSDSKHQILDVGFGMGHETTYFACNGFNVLAVDIEELFKKLLIANIERLSLPEQIQSLIEYKIGDILEMDFNDKQFSAIVAYNVIHFFDEKDCVKFFKMVDSTLETNGICFILAHHKDHPSNHENQNYFKQFFDKESLLNYFDMGKYNLLKYSYFENCKPIRWQNMEEKLGGKTGMRMDTTKEYQMKLILQKIK